MMHDVGCGAHQGESPFHIFSCSNRWSRPEPK